MNMQSKTNFCKFIAVLFATFVVCGLWVVLLDPFYHYHAPLFGIPAILDDAVYQTPGVARNFSYTDAILGTSMTENFHTDWFNDELGWNAIKLSYSGARSNDLNAILTEVFAGNRSVNHIFMDINDYQLTSEHWTAYTKRPDYLYDVSILNDYQYVYNKDVMNRGLMRLIDGINGRTDNLDDAYCWKFPETMCPEVLLEIYRGRREMLIKNGNAEGSENEVGLEWVLTRCEENLDNILPFITNHPETTFIIYFPPYSMLYWEDKLLSGKLDDIMATYKRAMEILLKQKNVELYTFQDYKDLIVDLNNYRDNCHHIPEYNRFIFEEVALGNGRITKENMEIKIQDIYEFVQKFDYETMYWRK